MSFMKYLKRDKYKTYDKKDPANADIVQTALMGSSMRSRQVGNNILRKFRQDGYTILHKGKPWKGEDKPKGSGYMVFDIQKDGQVIPNAVLKVIYHQQGESGYITFAEVWDRKRFEGEHK